MAEWTTSGGRHPTLFATPCLPDKVGAMFNEIWVDRPSDGLVNNAAGNFIVRIETLSPRAFDSVINIVLHGSAHCTMAAGKRWIEGKHRGTILSILATSTWQGRAFMVPSATAKAGELSMMRSLATESGPRRIRTVMVAPGVFPTPGLGEALP